MLGNILETHSQFGSCVHRLPAAIKLALAVTLVLLVVLTPATQPLVLLLPVTVLLVEVVVSRIPPKFLLWRLLLLEPIAIGVPVLSLFQSRGAELFLLLVLKTNLCLLAMVLLANTTPFSEILRVLQRLHFPALLVTTVALMYRYLFVLLEETDRMRRARASRSFVRSRSTAWQTLATVASQLFIRSSERAERIYAAMCARGWK